MSTKPQHDVRMTGFVSRKSFREVRDFIQQTVSQGPAEAVSVRNANQRVLAEDVVSPVNVPYFDRSAMDGYACRAEETSGATDYSPLYFKLIGDTLPGEPFDGELGRNEVVKIMTGGEIPTGANAVMMAEYTQLDGERVRFTQQVAPGKNVMRTGEDICAGDAVLQKGRRLRPQDLGVLASVHQGKVKVVKHPTVAIIPTGNELVEPDSEAAGTRIVDSNSYLLQGLVELYGGVPIFKGIQSDDYETLKSAIRKADEDIIVLSGGTSVGEEDYAPQVILELGQLDVHGVSMKPGSPFGMGQIGEQIVCLLPGSPVAAFVTGDAFLGSIIRRRLGQDTGFVYRKVRGKLDQKIVSSIGRTEFVRIRIQPDFTISKLRVSGASILTSTTRADGFLVVDEELEGYPEGAEVEVYAYD
jgi:molybdopterin molybdotransferase